jgi:hypothetical protein
MVPAATLSPMAKKPKEDVKKPKRKGFMVAMRLDEELERAFRQFLAAQRVPPNHGDVGIVALQEFLQREGFYPPKKE